MYKHDMQLFCVVTGSTYAQLDLTYPHTSVLDEIAVKVREQ